jgi:hypothetical protein
MASSLSAQPCGKPRQLHRHFNSRVAAAACDADLPKSTLYSPAGRTTMVFDLECRVDDDPAYELRQGLDALGVSVDR